MNNKIRKKITRKISKKIKRKISKKIKRKISKKNFRMVKKSIKKGGKRVIRRRKTLNMRKKRIRSIKRGGAMMRGGGKKKRPLPAVPPDNPPPRDFILGAPTPDPAAEHVYEEVNNFIYDSAAPSVSQTATEPVYDEVLNAAAPAADPVYETLRKPVHIVNNPIYIPGDPGGPGGHDVSSEDGSSAEEQSRINPLYGSAAQNNIRGIGAQVHRRDEYGSAVANTRDSIYDSAAANTRGSIYDSAARNNYGTAVDLGGKAAGVRPMPYLPHGFDPNKDKINFEGMKTDL